MSYADLLLQDARLVSRVEVKAQLRWLEERELVEIEEAGAVLLATLREKGELVVRGRVTVEGVKRPRI
jgi:pyridoxine/pyridoxamine 5'-phosphate oxidase